MKFYLTGTLILLLAGLSWAETGSSKQEAQSEETRVKIEGTSNLHDWKVEGNTIQGHLKVQKDSPADSLLKGEPGLKTESIRTTLQVEIPIRSLKSGKGGMDKRMYKALKEKDHPTITYRFKDAVWVHHAPIRLQTNGELTVAGVSRQVEMMVTVEPLQGGRLKIVGETSLKMTDFQIKPPRAIMGLIRTGNEIQIVFEWVTAFSVGKTEVANLSQ